MEPNVDEVTAQIKSEFPSYQTKNKADVWWMRALGLVLGASFMAKYVTTVGNTMYLLSVWPQWDVGHQCAMLRHERQHMRQAKRLTYPVYALLYFFALFPVGLAYARARLEFEAYSEQMQAWKDYGLDYASDDQVSWLVSQFTGPAYGFMWPFPKAVTGWFRQTVKRLS